MYNGYCTVLQLLLGVGVKASAHSGDGAVSSRTSGSTVEQVTIENATYVASLSLENSVVYCP